jgi:hypothetical protein
METTTVEVDWNMAIFSMVLFQVVSALTPTTHDLSLDHRENVCIVMGSASGLVSLHFRSP